MGADGDSVDAHLDNRVIVAARLGHIAKVENFGFLDVEFFEQVGHAEDFVHARDESVNRSGATDLVFVIWSELFSAGDDSFTLLAIWIPSVFGFGASFLAEGRESDLAEAVFDNFVTFSEFVCFPVAEFGCSSFDSLGDFFDLLVSKREVINLFPVILGGVEAVILGALSDEEVKMFELFWSGADVFEAVDDLD